VSIKGRTDAREDTVKLIASDISVLNTDVEAARGPVVVTMAPARCTPPMVDRLKDVLATHPGTTEVHLKLINGEREHLLRLGDGYRVKPSAALMGDLKALLGPTAISA
jgi:DNA polymerase-3 subunit alpha